MKKHLASAAILAVFGAGSAFAQNAGPFGNNLTVPLEAEVAEICGAEIFRANGADLEVGFNDLSTTAATDEVLFNLGRIRYVCNVEAGFMRTFESQNGGFLYRAGTGGGANNQIPWKFQHQSGIPELRITDQPLTAPFSDSIPGSAVFLAGTDASNLLFRASGVAVPSTGNPAIMTTNVFAGDYTDVLTVAITPN